jgi:hypothetical protein
MSLLLGDMALAVVIHQYNLLLNEVEHLMASVKSINDRLSALSTDLDRLTALFASEQGEEGLGGPSVATQAELDQIDSAIATIQAKSMAIKDEGPGVPSASALTDTQHFVTLSWNPTHESVSYNVKRGTASGAEIQLANVPGPSFKDTGTVAGTMYFYQVSAVAADGQESKNSAEVSITA